MNIATFEFRVLKKKEKIPPSGKNVGYIRIDDWDDYSYRTTFSLLIYSEQGELHNIGGLKIAFLEQTTKKDTADELDKVFLSLPENYFSVGQDVDYYTNLRKAVSYPLFKHILHHLKDVAYNSLILEKAKEQDVFTTSLLRGVKLETIEEQYIRVIKGQAVLTDFAFKFIREKTSKLSPLNLAFSVRTSSKPSTNIHAVIGRNGVGKTTFLNGIIKSCIQKNHNDGAICTKKYTGFRSDPDEQKEYVENPNYFSNLVSVSFSAFDPFKPPSNKKNPEEGASYFYVGLQINNTDHTHTIKSDEILTQDYLSILRECFTDSNKKKRLSIAINVLQSDENFAEMGLDKLLEGDYEDIKIKAKSIFGLMSSGHRVVLLTLTNLVAKVAEKTLVLIDEPESHLHPPLLSAFMRALSQLLYDRNGVAIIATHSPVVLQEIPKSCIWRIVRSGLDLKENRPKIETFGENVGILTREIFGLEVLRSGYIKLLKESVDTGKGYDEILEDYNGQIGDEGKSILQSMVIAHQNEEN